MLLLSTPSFARRPTGLMIGAMIVLLSLFPDFVWAQSDSFLLNGRQVELLVPGSEDGPAPRASGPDAEDTLILRDLASGQVRVYAKGLVLKLRQPGELSGLLRENPELRLQIAPGDLAYVSVDAQQLSSVFRRLSHDPRVVEIQLRAISPPLSPR